MPEGSGTANVVTILNLKGGVGKTHTAWLLASVCQERGKRVHLVDSDTQGNLSSSFIFEPDGKLGVDFFFHPGADEDPDPYISPGLPFFLDLHVDPKNGILPYQPHRRRPLPRPLRPL